MVVGVCGPSGGLSKSDQLGQGHAATRVVGPVPDSTAVCILAMHSKSLPPHRRRQLTKGAPNLAWGRV